MVEKELIKKGRKIMDKTTYKNKLLSILQEDVFFELLDFWQRVEEKKYDYKIFVSKKSYVLYQIFYPLFDFVDDDSCIKITDTAIPIFIDNMQNSSVLVIDDVYIHGRAAARLKKEIFGKVKKLDFFVFAKNSEHDTEQDEPISPSGNRTLSYKEILKKLLLSYQKQEVKGYVNCTSYQWKRVSDLIMKSMWGINIPYISYLPIVSVKKSVPLKLSIKEHQSTPRQIELGQLFSYFVNTNENSNEKNSIIHYCFIVSQNHAIDNCKIVPIVFFDCENTSINKDFIFSGIKIIYKEYTSELTRYFLKSKSNKGLVSLLKFLIFSVGYLAIKKWFGENGITYNEYEIDFKNAYYSFGDKIEKFLQVLTKITGNSEIDQLEKCKIKNSLSKNIQNEAFSKEHKDLLSGLTKAYNDMKSCSIEKDKPAVVEVLARYFKFNNKYTEQNLYNFDLNGKKFITGLRFSDIKTFLQSKGFTVEQIIIGLMYQYNLGAATIDFLYDYNKNGNIIGINMYWRAGEQSYKCISQTYVLLVYFNDLYNKMFDSQISSFLYEILVDAADRNYRIWNIPFDKRDLAAYSSRNDTVYNIFDIRRYCIHQEYRYLGILASEMQQYILRGNLQEVINHDKIKFATNLCEFIKQRTDENTLQYCKKILMKD